MSVKRGYFKNIIRFCLVAAVMQAAAAETFRVHKLFAVNISADKAEPQKIVTGINDSIAIFLPKDMTYIAGAEVLVEIPDAVANWRDSVALSLYDTITPMPGEDVIDYTGERVFVRALPPRPSWALRVPLSSLDSVKDSAYASKADIVPNTKDGFVFVRLQPAMKGIPDETMEATLQVSIRPLLEKAGKLSLNIDTQEGEKSFTLFIDNEEKPYKGEYLLETGAHEVSVVSELYRTEVRTVNIDTAKTTTLNITLKSIEPAMTVIAPESANVTLDGEACPVGKEFAVAEGEHTIRLVMGDWEVVRSITIQRGKSYTADFTVDMKLTEN